MKKQTASKKKPSTAKTSPRRAKRVTAKTKTVSKRLVASKAPRRAAETGTPDAVALLRADHVTMRKLLTELKAADTDTRRERLFNQVEQQLKAHTTIEEEIFYPAFREAAATKKDRELFFEATEEHRAADMVLREVGRARTNGDEFSARAKVLKELVEHHAEEEESDMFPRARTLLPAAELKTLGAEMAARKAALLKPEGPSTLQRVASMLPFTS